MESMAYSTEKNTSSTPLCSMNSINPDTDKSEDSIQYKKVIVQLSISSADMFTNEF